MLPDKARIPGATRPDLGVRIWVDQSCRWRLGATIPAPLLAKGSVCRVLQAAV